MHFELCWEYFTVNGEFFEIYWGAFADTAFESFFMHIRSIMGYFVSTLWYVWSTFEYFGSTLDYIGYV